MTSNDTPPESDFGTWTITLAGGPSLAAAAAAGCRRVVAGPFRQVFSRLAEALDNAAFEPPPAGAAIPDDPDPVTGEDWIITHISTLSNAVDDIWELLTAIGMKLSHDFATHPKSHPAVPGVRRMTQAAECERLTAALDVAREMLDSFTQTSDGYRARAGQMQIAKWAGRINDLANATETPLGRKEDDE